MLRPFPRHGLLVAAALFALCAGPSKTSAVVLGWYNLQWPPALIVPAGVPTPLIYGQVWSDGVTSAPGQGAGILAEVGYGPDGTQPTGPGWSWFPMSFNVDAGNNDEYMATFIPVAPGEYDYATRYSGDGGSTWNVADLNGPQPDNVLENPGALTVIPEPASLAIVATAGLLLRRRRS